jgi:prophage regulatory protein
MPTAPATPVSSAPGSTPSHPQPIRFLRFPAVLARTGLSRSTIWRLERRGEFPRHRRISPNAVAWVESEVTDWIRSRASSGLDGRSLRPAR